MTYYQHLLHDPRWQRKRLQIFERDAWACQKCGTDVRELHVHHRWYEGNAPWAVPSTALITLCDCCHREISMASQVVIVRKAAMTGEYGPIPTCITEGNYHYLAHQPLVSQVARKIGKSADTLWFMYLRTQGGEDFRKQVAMDLSSTGALNVAQIIQFERDGTKWLFRRNAIHFVAQNDPGLEHAIYKHFDETALAAAPQNSKPPAATGPLALIIQHSDHIKLLAQGLIDEEAARKKLGAVVDEHEQQLQAMAKQQSINNSPMIMREFVMTRLGMRYSDEQIKKWGEELSKQCRQKDSTWTPRKVVDPYARREVNQYTQLELQTFFRNKGLL